VCSYPSINLDSLLTKKQAWEKLVESNVYNQKKLDAFVGK
jgi:hypothetical protein